MRLRDAEPAHDHVRAANRLHAGGIPTHDVAFTSVLSAVIGALSFSGSIIAFLKLQEVMTGRPIDRVYVRRVLEDVILPLTGALLR